MSESALVTQKPPMNDETNRNWQKVTFAGKITKSDDQSKKNKRKTSKTQKIEEITSKTEKKNKKCKLVPSSTRTIERN